MPVKLNSTGGGSVTLTTPSTASDFTVTIPAATGTMVTTTSASTIEFAAGTVSAPSITTTGDTNTGIYFPAADTIAFTEGGVESMRINSSGNVGIGTSSPTATLNVVANTSSDALRITQTGAGNALVVEDSANPDSTPFVVNASGQVLIGRTTAPFGSTSVGIEQSAADTAPSNIDFLKNRAGAIVNSGDGLGRIRFWGYDGASNIDAAEITAAVDGTPGTNDMPGRLVFSTTADGASSPTERMRIDSSGNLLVGTSSTLFASSHAFVNSGTAVLGLRNSLSTAGKYWQVGPDSNSSFKVYNQSSVGMFLSDGSTSWSSSSDERQKNIIEPISDATNKVASLRAVIGSYKNDETNKRRSFLIAQDVQQVLPEAVTEAPDGFLGVAYSDVIPLLVAAIQELKADNDAMKERIALLEAK